MREIKFRAWDKKRKKMFEVATISFSREFLKTTEEDKDYPYESLAGYGGYDETERIENYKVMQFTGLKDGLDKEIYEGDIVHRGDGDFEVYFWHGSFALKKKNKTYGQIYGERSFGDTRFYTKVIGNIYETPELLSKGE